MRQISFPKYALQTIIGVLLLLFACNFLSAQPLSFEEMKKQREEASRLYENRVTPRTVNTNKPVGSISVNRTGGFTDIAPTVAMTPAQLVQEVFVKTGTCVTVSNVTTRIYGWNSTDGASGSWSNSSGTLRGLGFFNKSDSNFPIQEGLVLSTGNVRDIEGPNSSANALNGGATADIGDADLLAILKKQTTINTTVQNVGILEFDFVPTGNSMEFKYVFSSEEYPFYVNTKYNDVFGFFVNKVGSTTKTNIALLPNTNSGVYEVSISNVSDGGWNSEWTVQGGGAGPYLPVNNSNYFTRNVLSSLGTEMNGYTVVLTAKYTGMVPCEKYHLKLAIANAGDTQLGSAVFLQARSFDAGDNLVIYGNNLQGVEKIFKTCDQNYIRVSRSQTTSQPTTLQLSYSGTATNGTHYTQLDGTPLPSSITIPGNQAYLDIKFKATAAAVPGSYFDATLYCPCIGMTTVSTKRIYIYDFATAFNPAVSAACNGVANGSISIGVTGTSGVYEYSKDNGTTWQFSNLFSGLAAGTYNIKARDYGSCGTPLYQQVTITSLAALDLQVTGNATCVGTKATMTASSTSFTTPIFQWYSNAALTTLVGTGASFTTPTTLSANTTFYVKVSSLNSPCTRNIPVLVTVSTPPVVNAIAYQTFCSGSSTGIVTLSGTAGATFNWTNNTPSIGLAASGTGSIPSFSATNSGPLPLVATITATPVLNGCAGTAKTFTITVNPKPTTPTITATSSTTFCQGGSVVLTATAATSYQWYKDGNPIASATAQTYTANTSGAYTVKVKNSYGCESDFSGGTTIAVNPLPSTVITMTGNTPFCDGSSVLLTSSITGATATSYQWYVDGAAISGALSQSLTATVAGSYTVTVTNANGCTSPQSAAQVIAVWPKPTAVISGSKVVCETSPAVTLNVDLTGTQPWSITYTDGINPSVTVNGIVSSPYTISGLHPASSRTYTVSSVSDAHNCSSTGTGSGSVYFQPCGFGVPMMIWLKANDGVDIVGANAEQWNDKSGSGAEVLPAQRQAGTIEWEQNSINFNPSVVFNGQSQNHMAGTVKEPFPGDYTAFAVSKKSSSTATALKGVFTTTNTAGLDAGPGLVLRNSGTPYFAMDGTSPSTNTANTLGISPAPSLLMPSLISGVAQLPANNTSNSQIYLNGHLGALPIGSTPLLIDAQRFHVGGRVAESGAATAVFDGRIAEVMYFVAPLVATDMDKAATYLGIKYGISLPHNYLASDALPVWNQVVNAVYKTDITGIAKDNGYRLEQRISKNETPTTGTVTDIVTIANGKSFVTDQTLAKPISADKSYFIWGHNNGAKAFGALSNNRYLFNRVWKAQKTGTGIDTLSLQFNGITLPTPNNGTVTLLISTDPSFATIVSSKTVTASLTFESVIIPHNHYFTLATTTGIDVLGTASLWLKADKDLTGSPVVSTWKDQTINADLYTATNNPKRYLDVTDNVNFNPLVRFSGSAYLTGTTAIQLAHTYVVGKFATTGAQALANSGAMIGDKSTPGYLFRDMTGVSGIGFHDQSANASAYNTATKPQGIQLFGYKSVPSGKKNTYLLNGSKQALTNPNTVVNAYTEIRRIGTQGNPVGGYFQGDIAEVIGFADTLDSENKRLAVESYLAIKYGISLTSNYLASDYTTTWNQTQDANFRTQIAGIGRDDAFGIGLPNAGLAQQISHNVQPGADMVTIAHGGSYPASVANAQSGAAISADKSFFIWANNNQPTTFLPTASTVAGNKFYLMDRKWLVQKTGTGVGSVSIEMDTTGTRMQFPLGAGACRKLVLLSSANSSFSTATILGIASISATGKVVFNNLAIPTNTYFTLAVVELKATITSVGAASCDIDPNMQFPLVADLAVGETGKWTLVSITGGLVAGVSINNDASANTYAKLPVQNSTTDVVATFRWTVTNTQTACTDSKLITYTRFAKPPKPGKAAQDPAYCQNATAVPLEATALADYTLNWYSVAVGGAMTSIGTVAPTPITTAVGTVRYAVTQKHNTTLCESDTTQIDVITHPLPTVSMRVNSTDAVCLGISKGIYFDLTGTPPWNIIISDGTTNTPVNGIATTPHLYYVTPTNIGITTYTITNITDANTCNNVGTGSMAVSVNPIISIPKSDVTADTICPGADAIIKINPTTSGATYGVYTDVLGADLIESKVSLTGGVVTLNARAIQKTTDFYLKVTSLTGCQENRLVMIEVPVRPTLANYPDIRLQICPNPTRPLNLSSFLDTTGYHSAKPVNWTAVSSFSPTPSGEEGIVSTSDLTTSGIHVYTYSIANTCYPTHKTRKVYILPLTNHQIGKQVDTVAICKDFAEGINLRQILGLAAGGEWTYDGTIALFVRRASNYPFSNALILEGDKAFAALQSTAYQKPYKTDANAIHLDFIYTTTGDGSCLGAGTRRLVIVITSTILR